MPARWVFITGGVMSGLGKGIVSASIGKILQNMGCRVVPIKCDGYLNVDPGTMNPFEHGEVFVQDDGGEVDMDFGHYERFLGIDTKFHWNLTSGKIFKEVIEKERRGEYLGQTVQMIPHVTEEIKKRFRQIEGEEKPDIILVEIGGTVGDLENALFLESVRQFRNEGVQSVLVHVTLIPEMGKGEQKTKPTQHSIKELESRGLKADIIVGRCSSQLTEDAKRKISLFCNVSKEDVVSDPDVGNIYSVPVILSKEGLGKSLRKKLGIKTNDRGLASWERRIASGKTPLKIAICGKYTKVKDSYVSVVEALKHASFALGADSEIFWMSAEEIGTDISKGIDGVIVPGGFGKRGIEGKVSAIKYCRENRVPLLGLCLGLQMIVVEYARNVCGMKGANSTEMDPQTPYPVIDMLPGQKKITAKGGTMRLGGRDIFLERGSMASVLYKKTKIRERFRHRYEVNPKYEEILQKKGLSLAGRTEGFAAIVEDRNHPFLFGTQFHPEFTSRLEGPNPCYLGFVKACIDKKKPKYSAKKTLKVAE